VPYSPKPHRLRDLLALGWCHLWALLFLALVGMAVYGSLVQFWPYNLRLTLDHYAFDSNSVMAIALYQHPAAGLYTAITGTVLIMVLAWAQEKGRHFAPLRQLLHLLAMLSLAVPGMVLGLGYIFFFNGNPLFGSLHGTLPLMVLSCVIHYYTVGHMTAVTSLKQLPRELELVAISLRIPLWKAFWRVTLPASLPALLEIFIYLFVNAMTTTSAVIFLYSSDSVLASIAVLNMEDSGDTAAAAAMATDPAGRRHRQAAPALFEPALLVRTQRWRHSCALARGVIMSTLPFWLAEALAAEQPAPPTPLQGQHEVDVIVGGGFTGLWSAIALKQAEPLAHPGAGERSLRQRRLRAQRRLPAHLVGQIPDLKAPLWRAAGRLAGAKIRAGGTRDRPLLRAHR
jgi:ABC-type spermidine/putrescine transport system permease subunit II